MRNTICVVAATLLAIALPAYPQTWPSKPVRFIVTQAPGSAPDIICRLVTEPLSRALGQPIVVDNRPGAANVVGFQAAARAPADGYTLLFATSAGLTTNPYTIKALPYDPLKDFVPVAMIARGGFVLVANSKLPVKNLAELIALDKAQPGKLSMAVDGPRFLTGMLAVYMNKTFGTSFVQVPYNNVVQGVQDTAAGQTQLTINAPLVVDPFIKRGDLRPLAVTSSFRYPSMPDVPMIGETHPGFQLAGWFMTVAPAGTPREIVQRVNREMDTILKEPAIQQRLRDFAFFTQGAETLPALNDFLRSELALWGNIVKTIGIEPE